MRETSSEGRSHSMSLCTRFVVGADSSLGFRAYMSCAYLLPNTMLRRPDMPVYLHTHRERERYLQREREREKANGTRIKVQWHAGAG